MLQAGIDPRLGHLAAEVFGVDLAARGLAAFAQEGQHPTRQLPNLRLFRFFASTDEHETDEGSGMMNPRHRRVDGFGVDLDLKIDAIKACTFNLA
jgi:hypothetical protein